MLPAIPVVRIILRMAVGVFEVPSFLINNRIATTWFGQRERATCIAVYTSAEFVGLAFLTPLLAWLKVTFGWPAVFLFTGALGLASSYAFRRSYQTPQNFLASRCQGRARRKPPAPCAAFVIRLDVSASRLHQGRLLCVAALLGCLRGRTVFRHAV